MCGFHSGEPPPSDTCRYWKVCRWKCEDWADWLRCQLCE